MPRLAAVLAVAFLQLGAALALPARRLDSDLTCSTQERINNEDNDIGSAPGASIADCCDKCVAFSGCWAYSWNATNNGTCWLKSIKGPVRWAMGVASGALPGAPSAPLVTSPPLPPRPTTKTPPPSDHVQWKLRSGVIPSRSVNLGGWLVLEHWMSYTSPAWEGVDFPTASNGEYLTMKALGRERGTRQLVNDWGKRYNLAVMLDLHAHQGSQNALDHSAPQIAGQANWDKSQANVDNSLQFATFLAARYQHSEAFLGLNLMNEPSFPSYNVLLAYYREAYRRIRATGNDCIIATSPMLRDQKPNVMADFFRPPEFTNVWHEFHPYFKWSYVGFNETELIEAARGYRQFRLDPWTGNPLFLGEWSFGSPEATAPFKNRTLQKIYAAVQLESYEGAATGWSFWTWRNDQELNTTTNGILVGWSMRQLLREGIFSVPRA